MINYIVKKNVVPLIFILIFSQLKAESIDSAFLAIQNDEQQDTSLVLKKYILSKKMYDSGDYKKSAKYLLSLSNQKENKYIQILTNSLLARISEKVDDRKQLIYYLKKNINIINSYKNIPSTLIDTLNTVNSKSLLKLGGAYQKVPKIDSARYYYKKVEKVPSSNENVVINKAKALANLSSIYTYYDENRNLKLAKEYIKQSIGIFNTLNEKKSLSANYGILASIYEYENNIIKAKNYYLKAINLIDSVKVNSDDVLRSKEILYENYAWVLYKLKDYKSYNFLEKSYKVREELNDVALQAEIKKIESRHNVDLIKKEEENKRIKLERNNWLITITGIVVSLFLIYLVSLYKLRQNNLKLQLSKKELEQQKRLDRFKSESQIKIINATIDGKESERKQIAEALHDNVSALLSSANMHLQAFQKQSNTQLPIELQKTQAIILEASHKIRDLSHNLMSSILLKFGLEYAVKDIAKKYSNSSIQIHAVVSDLNRYPQEFEIKVFNIIQELLNNVLKHSKSSKSFVVIEEKEKTLHIVVKDNGKGISSEENLNTGIGLNQIKARVTVMKGVFKISRNEEQGTKVIIELPVLK